MKIVNMNNEKIKAAFAFTVRNCEISVSTIANENNPEIAIFDLHGGELLKDNIGNVQKAIDWAITYGPRD